MTNIVKKIGIIPAHLGSIRFKRKILHNIFGLPMIEHVRRRVINAGVLEEVFIASGDKEILETVTKYGGQVIKTFDYHPNGTSRVAEAVENIDCTHVVVIQGDEPLIQKKHLENLICSINENPNFHSWNSTSELIHEKELSNINVVKASLNTKGRILYFFRKSPSLSNSKEQFKYIKKVQGLIAYRKEILLEIAKKPISIAERLESIEQIRILENEFNIYSVHQDNQVPSINTKDDLKEFYEYLESHHKQYILTKELINNH